MTFKEIQQMQNEVVSMSPEELYAFRNRFDPDRMGNEDSGEGVIRNEDK